MIMPPSTITCGSLNLDSSGDSSSPSAASIALGGGGGLAYVLWMSIGKCSTRIETAAQAPRGAMGQET